MKKLIALLLVLAVPGYFLKSRADGYWGCVEEGPLNRGFFGSIFVSS